MATLLRFPTLIPTSASRSTAEYQPLTATTAMPAIMIASMYFLPYKLYEQSVAGRRDRICHFNAGGGAGVAWNCCEG
jgi:hypothetical protein